jgi:hypothetical protein
MRQEVGRRNHHHHAQRGVKHEEVVLALVQAAVGHVLAAVDQHHDHGEVGHQLEEVGQQVVDEHVAEGQRGLAVGGDQGDRRAAQQGDHGQHGRHPAVGGAENQVDEQYQEGHPQEKYLRSRRVEVGHHEIIQHRFSRVFLVACPRSGVPGTQSACGRIG